MISISIPNNNLPERTYILEIFFKEFLGISYALNIRNKSEFKDWEILLENGNKLIIEDHFFSKYKGDLEYLDKSNLPQDILFGKLKEVTLLENDVPIIYGTDTIEKKGTELLEYRLGVDIFSSSFFMLTRWEEYVNTKKDKHHRFSSEESIAFKYGFTDRPVVNEYLELLKSLLKSLNIEQKFKKHHFEMMLSHDVDVIQRFSTFKSGLGELIRDLTVRKNPKLFLGNCILKLKSFLPFYKDPYDTFDFLMNVSEDAGVKSYFFFMAEGMTDFDNRYKSDSEEILTIVEKIKKRKHHIGIHPTYNAYNNVKQFKKEKEELMHSFDVDTISFGRQHFLRFEVPTTWQIWEDNNMLWDSTLSYADKEGFRCGVCYEYSVFNILTRQKLQLKEKPLVVMEGSFATYQGNISKQEMISKINVLKDKVKKYNGTFVLLWHNSSFNTPFWNKYKGVYEQIVKA